MTVCNVILNIPHSGHLRFRRSTTNSPTCHVEMVRLRPGGIGCCDLRISRMAVSPVHRSTWARLMNSTKRVVRRRLRKGAMTPGQSRTGGSFGGVQASGIGSAIRAMSGFKKSKNDPTQSQSQSQSQTQSRHGQGQSQGYGQDSQLGVPSRFGYPSIMQELELDTTGFDDSRKGSVATSDGKKVEGEK